MDKQQLREYLNQLTDAIEDLRASEDDKQRLNGLIGDIEHQLTEPQLTQEPSNLVDQVDSLVSSFERDHPTVAAILNNIMITLTSMGV